MTLTSPTNMGQVDGVCCRQAPVRGLIGGLVGCAVLIGAAIVTWHFGAPQLICGAFAVVAALFVALVTVDVLAKFRPTNWLTWLGPDGLWINFRSYQNRHLPEAVTVLYLSYEEITFARRHIDTWTTPSEPTALTGTHWKQESLELSLVSGDTREIAKVLANERDRRATITFTHQAVTVPAAGIIRIAWRGVSDDVSPSLTRVLDQLSQRIQIADPTRMDYAAWHELGEAELDDLIAQLVRSGDKLEASKLLTRLRSYSATEAHKFLEDLGTRV